MTTTIEPTVPTMPCPDWCENAPVCDGTTCFCEPVYTAATAQKTATEHAQPLISVHRSRETGPDRPATMSQDDLMAITVTVIARDRDLTVSMTISEAENLRDDLDHMIACTKAETLALKAAGR